MEKVQRQQRLTQAGKFRVRHHVYYLGDNPIAADKIVAYLDANDLSQTPDPVASLAAAFPALPKPGASFYKIIDDGRRRRNTFRFDSDVREVFDTVSNGLEVVDYNSGNRQADIYDARRGGHLQILGVSDFSSWPRLAIGRTGSGTAKDDVQRVETGDRVIVEQKTGDSAIRWVVDRKTGFLLASSWRLERNGHVGGGVIRQYGPKTYEGGGILPTVHVQLSSNNDYVNQIFLSVVENADLTYRPAPLDFVVPAPAGTVILDHREDREHPKQGMNRYPVVDVIAYADGLTSRHRSIDPVLKMGQPAPAIQPVSWLDRSGRTDPPDLSGKVVLVDFWGIDCGFCVVQLPEVQAAADHFAAKSKDFVLIGLHDSGGTVAQVSDFARKRGLTYRLAIDRPAVEDGWFGATFQEYGVRAIPGAAVIDRQGKVVFVGRFSGALQKAAKLLGP